ncbi:P-loop containing nucleoside triphosphate hydrolase protein, partial [Delphinella strobiligena]
MADDGMLLNFAVPDEPWQQAGPRLKGGSWKDRLTAKKAMQYGRREKSSAPKAAVAPGNQQSSNNANHAPLGVRKPRDVDTRDYNNHAPRPFKRQRVEGGADFRPSNERWTETQPGRERGPLTQAQGGPKQVISSLFTYNPTSMTAAPEEAEEVDETPVEPSNAPLSPELQNFTQLGLSPNVGQHLLNKMQIKAPTSIQKRAVEQLIKEDSDAFIQAQTGSGKTLAYLLPIVQRLINISESMKKTNGTGLSRDSGLFAIILAPTRELSKQIATVLEELLGCAHWLVTGTVIGGEKKKSEKARLRKGLNILVATPGRLVDHLDHTETMDVSNVRWLVLDEGDRLMELGFEQDIQKIVSVLNLRMRKVQTTEIPGLPERRTTVLCSATIKNDVNRLGSITLKEAVSISAEPSEKREDGDETETAFQAPAQLKQSFAVVPAKLRLVTLVAILRRAFARKGSVMKTIVFISCADSVDFHFEALAREEEKTEEEKKADEKKKAEEKKKAAEEKKAAEKAKQEAKSEEGEEKKKSLPSQSKAFDKKTQDPKKIKQGGTIEDTKTEAESAAISGKDNTVMIFRLHGSLPQAIRTSTLKAFSTCTQPAVLVCTDVASRGLDLPNVDFVIEYDPAFSKDDHLHRVGRTARAGRDGRSLIFLQPGNEEKYVDILKDGRGDGGRGLTRHDADELLKKGFMPATGKIQNSREWEDKATDLQLDLERWTQENPKHLEQARRAYQSHIRAYATHVAAEREIFNMKTLHLGHLAKAFALRDKPGSIKVPGLRPGADSAAKT